jgi:hypothetical protein
MSSVLPVGAKVTRGRMRLGARCCGRAEYIKSISTGKKGGVEEGLD